MIASERARRLVWFIERVRRAGCVYCGGMCLEVLDSIPLVYLEPRVYEARIVVQCKTCLTLYPASDRIEDDAPVVVPVPSSSALGVGSVGGSGRRFRSLNLSDLLKAWRRC